MKKKRSIVIGVVIVLIMGCALFSIILKRNHSNVQKDNFKSLGKYEKEYCDDWAFYNYGQSVNGVKGVEGIDIDVFGAWNITKGDKEVRVGIVDTGIDVNENKIKSHIFGEEKKIDGKDDDQNGYIDDINGWDFYNNDNSVYDKYSHDYHGTYVANEILRVAPNISIIPAKFMEGTKGSLDDAVEAIQYLIERGARIINCSWNFENYSKKMYNIIKNNPNVLFVCAAGNSNLNLDENKLYPCSYKADNIMTVGAIDSKGVISNVSGYGKKVDVLAPGVNVKVCLPENDIDYLEGTSISTAIVSGEAALILSINKNLTSSQIKEIIISSCIKKKSMSNWCSSEGYINVGLAVIQAGKY